MAVSSNPKLLLVADDSKGVGSLSLELGTATQIGMVAGVNWRLLRQDGDRQVLLENVVAKRIGDDLVLVDADGTTIVFSDFFVECEGDACSVTVAGDDAAGYRISASDSGLPIGGEETLLYAHGDSELLMSMVCDNRAAQQLFAAACEGSVSRLTLTPEAAAVKAAFVPGLVTGFWGTVGAMAPAVGWGSAGVTMAVLGSDIDGIPVSSTLPPTPEQLALLTPDEVSRLSPEQVAQFGPEHFEVMRPEQIAALTPEQAAVLTPEQVRDLADNNLLDDLNDEAEGALSVGSLGLLTTAQIAGLPTEFVEDLAPATVASLSNEQLEALSDNQIGAIAAGGGLSELTADQFTALGIDGVDSAQQAALLADALSTEGRATTVAQVQALADAAQSVMDAAAGAADVPSLEELALLGVGGVTADSLAAVQAAIRATADDGSGVDTINELQTVALMALTPEQIAPLTPEEAAMLTPEQVKALADNDLLDDLNDAAEGALSPDSLDLLTPEQIAALPPEFIESLAPATVASLNTDQVAALTPDQVAALTAEQVAALTVEQSAVLTPEQVKALADNGLLDDLNDAAEGGLSPDSLDLLTTDQITALPTEFVEDLAPATVASLSDAQLEALSDDQIGALAAGGGLSGLNADQFTTLGINGVDSAQQAALLADALGAEDRATTVAQVQALADAAQSVLDAAAGTTGVPSLDELALLGIVGVTADSLAAVQAAIQATADNGNDVDSVAELQAVVGSVLPGININDVTGDNVITLLEDDQDILISGTTINIEDGQTVTVTFNGKTYTATVNAGVWETTLPAADAQSLPAGQNELTAVVDDLAGVTATQSLLVNYDTTQPTIAIDPVAVDNVINDTEDDATVVVSGSTINVESGQSVTLIVGGQSYSALVNASGNWSVSIPAADAQALAEGKVAVYADVSNLNGDQADRATLEIIHDTTASISIGPVSNDNVINASGAGEAVQVSGFVVGIEDGQTITVTLRDSGGQDVTPGGSVQTTVMNGAWSVELTAAQIASLSSGEFSIQASAQDTAGNEASSVQPVTVQDFGLVIELSDSALTVGQSINVTFRFDMAPTAFDASYVAVQNGTLSNLSPAADGSTTVFTAEFTPVGVVDADNMIQVVMGDNGQPRPVALAEFANQVNVNYEESDFTLQAAGNQRSWQFSGAFSESSFSGDGSLTFIAGLPATSAQRYMVGLSEQDDGVSHLTIDYALFLNSNGSIGIYENGVLRGLHGTFEAGDVLAVTRTGTTIEYHNLSAAGGNTLLYTSTVASTGGDLHVDASFRESGAGAEIRNVVLSNDAAPTADQSSLTPLVVASDNYSIAVAQPVITLDAIAGDNTVTIGEIGNDIQITGSTLGVEAGRWVTVVIDNGSGSNKTFYGLVQSDGSWAVTLPSVVAQQLDTSSARTVTANVSNAAGQAATQATASLTVNGVGLTIELSDSELMAGETAMVTFTFGTAPTAFGGSYVIAENGTLSNFSPAANGTATEFTATFTPNDANDISNVIQVVLNDAGQPLDNPSTQSGTTISSANYRVLTQTPGISIDTIAGDDIITATEARSDIKITGSAQGVEAGQPVTVTITDPSGNKIYQGLVQSDGTWEVTLPSAVAQALGSTTAHTVTASVSNANGQAAAPATQNLTFMDGGLTITLADDELTAGETTQVTFTFNTAPAMFDDSYVMAENGTLSNFTVTANSDGKVFTATFTPDSAVDASNMIRVVLDENGVPRPLNFSNFINQVNVSYDESTLTLSSDGPQTTWSRSGAFSESSFSGDGSLTFVAGLPSTSRQRYMAGLSQQDENESHLTIDYALYMNSEGRLGVFENGRDRRVQSTFEEGDVLAITRVGNKIRYYNLTQDANNPIYESNVASSGDLHVDVGFREPGAGAEIRNVVLSDNAAPAVEQSGFTPFWATSDNYSVATVPPTLTLDPIANITTAQIQSGLEITGSTQGVEVGQFVTVVINGNGIEATYQGFVTSDGSWKVTLPDTAAQFVNVGAQYTVTAGVSNADGQAAPTVTENVTVNGVGLTIELSDSELAAGETATVTFTFDTAPAMFNADHVMVDNGVLSNLTPAADGAERVFTATFTPANTTDISNVIQVIVDQNGQPLPQNFVDFVNQVNAGYDSDGFALSASGGQSDWGFSGAFSESSLSANGSLTFVAGLPEGVDQRYMVGLSTADEGVGFQSIDYALYIQSDGRLGVFESGKSLGTKGSVKAGDVLAITRVGSEIQYHNLSDTDGTTLIYTSVVPSTGDLHVDVSFRSAGEGAEISNVVLSDNASPTAAQSDYTAVFAVSDNYSVLTQDPSIGINAIAGDDVLDALEVDSLVISGNVTGVVDGQLVTVDVGGQSYIGQVDNGAWSVRIPADDAAALPDNGMLTLTASVQAQNGAVVGDTRDFQYDAGSVLTILMDQSGLAANDTATVTFIFKQAVSGFDLTDIHAPNGVLSNLTSQDNVTWTATFTPNDDTVAKADFISVGSDWTYTATGKAPSSLPGVELALFDGIDVAANGNVQFDGLHRSAVSVQSIGADGGVSALISQTDTSRSIGLTADNGDDRGAARYAIRLNDNGTLDIVENGMVQAVFGENPVYRSGDTVSVERYNDTVVYRHNDSVVYVSQLSSAGPLYVEASFDTENAMLENVQINRFTGSSSGSYLVNTATPSIMIDAVSLDDAISRGEAFVITGTTTNVEDGQSVSVALSGNTYQATVMAGAWSVVVPPADALALNLVNIPITANVGNALGVAAIQANRSVTYSDNPAVTLMLDDATLTVGETATLTVTFDQAVIGFDVDSLTVANGSLSDLQSNDGGITWTASYTPQPGVDVAGNVISLNPENAPFYASNGQQVSVMSVVTDAASGDLVQQNRADSNAFTVSTSTPLISVDLVGGDNVVSPNESANGFVISGMAYGVAAGQMVTLVLASEVYQGVVSDSGAWQVVVPKSNADALSLGNNSYVVSVESLAGVPGSTSGRFTYDATPSLEITLDDSALAAGEQAQVTFTFSADVQDFDLSDVTVGNGTLSNFVSVDGKTYTAQLTPAADTTAVGNVIEVNDRWSFVDSSIAPAVTVAHATFDTPVGDVRIEASNLVKSSDQPDGWDAYVASKEMIVGSGSVRSTVAETDTARMIGLSAKDGLDNAVGIDFAIHLTASGLVEIYESGSQVASAGSYNRGDTITVERIGAKICYWLNDDLVYASEKISTGDLYIDAALFSNGATLNNIVIDDGNTAVSDPYAVLTGTPVITLDMVAGDNVIGAVEANRDLLVTGAVTHVADGEQIMLALDGRSYTAMVVNGEFAAAIPASDLQALSGGAVSLTANYTNAAGGTATATQSVSGGGAVTPLTITVDDTAIDAGETATVTFTFAEAVTGFDLSDIQVGSGTLSNLSSSDGGMTWTAQLTAEPGSQAMHNVISVNNDWTFSGNSTPVTTGEAFGVVFDSDINDATTVVNGNNVTKVALFGGWAGNGIGTDSLDNVGVDSGAFSVQAINGDGYLSARLGDDNGVKAIGLSYTDANDSFESMDYAVVHAADGSLSFYQAGVLQVSTAVTAGSGDVLRINVNDTDGSGRVVSVSRNGDTIFTFAKAANVAPLHADIALSTVGAAFYDVMMSDDAVAVSGNYAVDAALTLQDASVTNNVIALTYSEVLATQSVPGADSFDVKVDGAGRQITDVTINGNQLLVTFDGGVVTDTQQVEYSYTATGTNTVQDQFGAVADNVGSVIFGNDNLRTLQGTADDDTIVGTSANDVIAGNGGNDYLIGLQGSDTFDFNNLPLGDDNGIDTIADFQMGAGGDVIDISDVLDGFESGSSDLADFVRAETFNDADDRVVLQIDTDGVGNVNSDPFNANMTIVLDNVSAGDVDISTFVAGLDDNNNIVLG